MEFEDHPFTIVVMLPRAPDRTVTVSVFIAGRLFQVSQVPSADYDGVGRNPHAFEPEVRAWLHGNRVAWAAPGVGRPA